jgi:hypothetical protein
MSAPRYVLVAVDEADWATVQGPATIVREALHVAGLTSARTAVIDDVVDAATNPDLDDNARRYTYVGVVEALEALS